ncbi:aspartate kinase [Nocardiopsis sp. RSe5-2]|uniref:Aspartokinase n=1 Tax=Nocardiopsis endophytica TaxID=3018445 RepID=A0ABT4U4Z1_9ACTN|nr:aspartate kinase [Nocardiopsis endophytica]MDA2811407.1 aspartate kinase [Nocardiopsis endophytica]
MNAIAVQKFGGSSLAEPGQVLRAAGLVRSAHRAGNRTVVCVSARGDTTDRLVAEAGAFGAPDPREADQLLATGETASAATMAMALGSLGVPAVSMTAAQAGIAAAPAGGEMRISGIDTAGIRAALGAGRAVVVAGFQGVDASGATRTLGRGGSDTTAVALAAALGAPRCAIYTDVDGVYTADPRTVPDARAIPRLPLGVMSEMAISGARVLHARAVELAAVHGITITVAAPDSGRPGTVVHGGSTDVLEGTGFAVAVTHTPRVARILLQGPGGPLTGVLAGVLAERRIPLEPVGWTSGAAGSEFAVRAEHLPAAEEALREAAAHTRLTYAVDASAGQVSLVGVGLLNRPEYTGRILRALEERGIPAEWALTTQSRASVLVPAESVGRAAAAVHEEFGLARPDASPAGAAT